MIICSDSCIPVSTLYAFLRNLSDSLGTIVMKTELALIYENESPEQYLSASSDHDENGNQYEAFGSQQDEIVRTWRRRESRKHQEAALEAQDSPRYAHRSSGSAAITANKQLFKDGGALDSQTDSQEFIDRLMGAPASQPKTNTARRRRSVDVKPALVKAAMDTESEREVDGPTTSVGPPAAETSKLEELRSENGRLWAALDEMQSQRDWYKVRSKGWRERAQQARASLNFAKSCIVDVLDTFDNTLADDHNRPPRHS
ncbi:unnamed protein product [Mycena citricolor]|uniref:Uncharacterized protein n=1 Tax=Mycena citricolor TaxID=2018698 RepID=A0AAD2HJD6_9AGAR|nr:unnamed protein product [Mycena citricolor]